MRLALLALFVVYKTRSINLPSALLPQGIQPISVVRFSVSVYQLGYLSKDFPKSNSFVRPR